MTKSQNIYDDPVFFAGYKELRAGGSAQNDWVDQPALWSLLGDSLTELSVLDLGCGMGSFARKARAHGARAVLGIDLSQKMLDEARRTTNDHGIEYRRSSIEDLALEKQAFDLVASSLMLHYVKDYGGAVQKIASYLKPGGRFVFSVEHPMFTARAEQAWIRDGQGKPLYWPVDNYREEGERRVRWFVEGVVKYHRTVETYVNTLIEAGFSLQRLLEPGPIPGSPPEAEPERRRPPFLLIAVTKP